MDTEPDDLPLIRCAVFTRQSAVRAGDEPALASCAVQSTLCTEFIRSMAWRGWYPIGERFDDEGYSGATIERPGLEKLIARIQDGDVQRVIVGETLARMRALILEADPEMTEEWKWMGTPVWSHHGIHAGSDTREPRHLVQSHLGGVGYRPLEAG